MTIKPCAQCGKQFCGLPHRKYCDDCRREIDRQRRKRRYELEREYEHQRYIKSKLAALRGDHTC